MSDIDLKKFFLEQVRLFESFPADKVEEIVSKSRLATYEGNEAMLETGDEGRTIGIIIDGEAEISITDNTGTRSVISLLAPGDVFGVMSLLTGDRVVADVIASSRCFVLMIPQDVFNTCILTNPKAVAHLSRLLADRTRVMSMDLVTAQARAVAKSDDPYALSLNTNTPGKKIAMGHSLGASVIYSWLRKHSNDPSAPPPSELSFITMGTPEHVPTGYIYNGPNQSMYDYRRAQGFGIPANTLAAMATPFASTRGKVVPRSRNAST